MGGKEDVCTRDLVSLLGCLMLAAACSGRDRLLPRIHSARLQAVVERVLGERGECKRPLAVLRVDQRRLEKLLAEAARKLEEVEASNAEGLAGKLAETVKQLVLERFDEVGRCEPSKELLDLISKPVITEPDRLRRLQGILEALLEEGVAAVVVVPQDKIFASSPGIAAPDELLRALRAKRGELEQLLGKDALGELEAILSGESGKTASRAQGVEESRVVQSLPRDVYIDVSVSGPQQPHIVIRRGSPGSERNVADWNQFILVMMEVAREYGVPLSYEMVKCIRDKVYDAVRGGGKRTFRFKELLEECRRVSG